MILPSKYKAPPKLLEDKVIMITGAGSGIGKEAAYTFAKFGANTILISKNISHLEQTYDLFLKNNLKEPVLHLLDLEKAEEADFKKISEAVLNEYGKLDGLLNNAGILGIKMPLENYPISQWRKVFRINLEASFLLTKSLLIALKKPKDSSVVFTSSGVGRRARAYWGAYSLTKFATEGLVQILSQELEKTSCIRVNAINPGPVRTNMRLKAYPAENPKINPEPKDIMNAYLYLMGKDSLNFSGNSIEAQ